MYMRFTIVPALKIRKMLQVVLVAALGLCAVGAAHAVDAPPAIQEYGDSLLAGRPAAPSASLRRPWHLQKARR